MREPQPPQPPTEQDLKAVCKMFDWIARMRPEIDRRKREREKELRK